MEVWAIVATHIATAPGPGAEAGVKDIGNSKRWMVMTDGSSAEDETIESTTHHRHPSIDSGVAVLEDPAGAYTHGLLLAWCWEMLLMHLVFMWLPLCVKDERVHEGKQKRERGTFKEYTAADGGRSQRQGRMPVTSSRLS